MNKIKDMNNRKEIVNISKIFRMKRGETGI